MTSSACRRNRAVLVHANVLTIAAREDVRATSGWPAQFEPVHERRRQAQLNALVDNAGGQQRRIKQTR